MTDSQIHNRFAITMSSTNSSTHVNTEFIIKFLKIIKHHQECFGSSSYLKILQAKTRFFFFLLRTIFMLVIIGLYRLQVLQHFCFFITS